MLISLCAPKIGLFENSDEKNGNLDDLPIEITILNVILHLLKKMVARFFMSDVINV